MKRFCKNADTMKPIRRSILSALILLIRHCHISHNASYLSPNILHKHCFQFLLGRLLYPGEMKNKGYAKIGRGRGQIRCIMGNVEVASESS